MKCEDCGKRVGNMSVQRQNNFDARFKKRHVYMLCIHCVYDDPGSWWITGAGKTRKSKGGAKYHAGRKN